MSNHQAHSRVFVVLAWTLGLSIAACNVDDSTKKATFPVTAEEGSRRCVAACRIFAGTNCETRAAEFCKNAEKNCESRYSKHLSCASELGALDACAASQPASNFTCPLGTIADEIRPYRLSEDACVEEARAVSECL
jgi:hypothetical protein